MDVTEWVVLARLVRPQGRKGEILADLLTDFPERFNNKRSVFLLAAQSLRPDLPPNKPQIKPQTQHKIQPPAAAPPRPIDVENHWLHKGRIVLKFSGVDSINDAELLRGMDVAIPREERAALAGDEVYIDDLLDCVVYDSGAYSNSSGTMVEIGRVADVDTESTAGALLVVDRANGDEVLIPFVKAYLQHIDVAAKRIEMKLPEGLLEVNAAPTQNELDHNEGENDESDDLTHFSCC